MEDANIATSQFTEWSFITFSLISTLDFHHYGSDISLHRAPEHEILLLSGNLCLQTI